MRTDNSEGILTVFLEGDLDAQNAADVQQEIKEILESQGESDLVFDARELEYLYHSIACPGFRRAIPHAFILLLPMV